MDNENLENIIKEDIYKRAEDYINLWFNSLGIEATLELLERNKNASCYRIYKDILQKRGLIK